jgi:hypothetical protein
MKFSQMPDEKLIWEAQMKIFFRLAPLKVVGGGGKGALGGWLEMI